MPTSAHILNNDLEDTVPGTQKKNDCSGQRVVSTRPLHAASGRLLGCRRELAVELDGFGSAHPISQ